MVSSVGAHGSQQKGCSAGRECNSSERSLTLSDQDRETAYLIIKVATKILVSDGKEEGTPSTNTTQIGSYSRCHSLGNTDTAMIDILHLLQVTDTENFSK